MQVNYEAYHDIAFEAKPFSENVNLSLSLFCDIEV